MAAAFATATLLHGQPGDGIPPGPPPLPPLFALLDTDRDGKLSAEEIENAAEPLARLDRNQDGEITRDELRPPPPPEEEQQDETSDRPERRGRPDRRGHMGPPPLVAALDADRDGTISAEEIANASESLAQLDKNGDGELSPRELFPGRGGPPPKGGPGPQGR